MFNKVIKFLKNPIWLLVFLNNRRIFCLPDKIYLKIIYWCNFNKKLNLDNPQTFNEKLQWLKLYDRKEIYSKMVDKYEVKKIIENSIGSEYVIPTYGVYQNFDEINFEELPSSFVIKCTHFGGNKGVVVVPDKSKINIKKIRKEINVVMKKNLFYSGREWPYKNVKPRIIVEKYVSDKSGILNDFKLQTFNGKVAYSFVCTNRALGNVKYTFFDKNKKFIPVMQCGAKNDLENAKLPNNYEKFVELAERLAKNLPEVRVDFYDVDGKIYFGELTFFDSSGFGKFEPEEWDYKFGQMLKLPKKGE